MSVDLEHAVRELAAGLLRYCAARTRDSSLAEEIAQECLAALVQRWRRHGPPASPEAFVFAVARRRSARALVRRRLLLPLQYLQVRNYSAPSPESLALDRSDLRRLLRAMDRLSAREREALLLVVVGGLSTAGAARAIRISESALKMRVSRARERLHALLEDNHEDRR